MLALLLLAAGCNGNEGAEEGESDTAQTAVSTSTETEVDDALAAKVKRLIRLARSPQPAASPEESIRIADAQADLLMIASRNPAAVAPLTDALEKPDYALITDLYNFYIQLGEPGSEDVLVAALDRLDFGQDSSAMALAYLASDNRRLIRGAQAWAGKNNLTISGKPSAVGPTWGSMGQLAPPDIPAAPPPAP